MSLRVPAEWSPHRAMWLGFPSHAELWEDDLGPAQAEVAALARALAGPGGERVRLMACGEAAVETAQVLLGDETAIEIVPGLFGDAWLRDTGPIFTGPSTAAAFGFNGWGGKYILEGDGEVDAQIGAISGARPTRPAYVPQGSAPAT